MRIVVANLAEAVAALDRNPDDRALLLWSPPDAAAIHGVMWFIALQRALDQDGRGARVVLDCGDRADLAIEAMRGGLHDIAFNGSPEARPKVRDIARQLQAHIHDS